MNRIANFLMMFVVCPAALLAACATTTTDRLGLPPLEAVPQVDLSRYVGTWYEIASFPQRFQKGCTGTTANYTLQEDGEIRVLNRCRKGSLQGKEDSAEGRARVTDPVTNAKLEVTFFWPFWGEYWIVDLDPDYQFAVVGHPGRDYLWILSRTPSMEKEVYTDILERLRNKSYQVERLQRTVQPQAESVGASPHEG
ncbi:lipocalin family protein [Myxococcota bacterium]